MDAQLIDKELFVKSAAKFGIAGECMIETLFFIPLAKIHAASSRLEFSKTCPVDLA